MSAEELLKVGDEVRLLEVADAVGLVVEFLGDDVARVEWTAGKGLVGRRTVHPVKSLRKLA